MAQQDWTMCFEYRQDIHIILGLINDKSRRPLNFSPFSLIKEANLHVDGLV
jgi:hypothetical protein